MYRYSLLRLIVCLLLCSCSIVTMNDQQSIANLDQNKNTFVIDNFDYTKSVSNEDIKGDISYLIQMLQNAYSGSHVHDKNLMESVYANLQSIPINPEHQNDMSIKYFCYKITEVLSKLPDNHLYSFIPKIKGYSQCKISNKKDFSNVGNNIQQNPNLRWSLTDSTTPLNNKIKTLAISSFDEGENLESIKWKGFVETSQILFKEKYFIVDLRGNRGGSTPVVQKWILNFFNGNKKLLGSQYKFVSNDSILVRKNYWQLNSLWATNKEEKTFYQKASEREIEKLTKLQINNNNSWQQINNGIYQGAGQSQYRGTAYLLMDKHTGSAAEFFIELMDAAFEIIKIGTPTSGTTQFGNIGYAILPATKIYVQMGISYSETRYGMIETKGIPPDVFVTKDNNALDIALNLIDKRFKD